MEQEVKSVMNGQTSLPAKPTSKPKGIMGMFGNKNAPKNEKDIKSEKEEDTPVDVPAVPMFTTRSSLKDLVIHTLPTVTRTLVLY